MNRLYYIFVNVALTLLRVLPFSHKTGLIKIGNPGREAPVLVTCNYYLTVVRLKKALKGIDAYLLVANSRGVNVWCAATGGHFTNHEVISVLRTSGVAERVDHRNAILPQLAATGIVGKTIHSKTGWRIIWGPVDAKDIPAFLRSSLMKTPQMRRVDFPWEQRAEMAVAWAFPLSAILACIAVPFWREAVLRLSAAVWGLSFLVFLSFPLYSPWLKSKRKGVGFAFNDFGRGGLPLTLWGICMLGLAAHAVLSENFAFGSFFFWSIGLAIIVLVLTLDLMGSTPVYKSGTHEDRLLEVFLDKSKCNGAGFCEQVCPKNCFEVDKLNHIATMPRAHECVQCGACIVQCPFDALYFKNQKGQIISPENTRTYKLNLAGKRLVKIG